MRYAVTYDVVFALDDSSGVPRDGWTSMLNLASSFVDQFYVGLGSVRIGVVRYSNTASVAFDLNQYRTGTEVKAAIGRLPYISRSSDRNLADAFRITMNQLLVRGERYFAAKVGTSLFTTSLVLPRTMRTISERDLSHAAPLVWNTLPTTVHELKL